MTCIRNECLVYGGSSCPHDREAAKEQEYQDKIEELENKIWHLRFEFDQLTNRVEAMSDDIHHFLGG